MSTLSDFKSSLIGGGARSSLFQVDLRFPSNVNGGPLAERLAPFMVKAASLPGSVINAIEVPYRGRKLKIAGDRTFEPWTITVINDTGMEIRNAFEDWMHQLSRHEENTTTYGNNLLYMAEMAVTQIDRVGNPGKIYTIVDAWPANISAIEVNFETEGVQEFTVEMQYQYWLSDTTTA
jgi:hypothetical protein